MRIFADIAELEAAAGQELGTSPWVTVDQAMIDRFAEATGDFQWIHVDRARAATSPFGTTVAHGYLTLSLLPRMGEQVYRVDGIKARLNYGSDRVRFLAPVPSGSRLRARFRLAKLEKSARGVLLTIGATIEIEGSERPACVAELLTLLIPA
jgi:acyl dehydratase